MQIYKRKGSTGHPRAINSRTFGPDSFRGRRLLGLTLLAALLSSCIPLPYVSPPVRVSAGHGGSDENGGIFALRVGIAPQQVIKSTIDRAWDVEAGYTYEGGEKAKRHGGFLTGRWWPTRGLQAPNALRFGVEGGGSAFADGVGAHVGLNFEVARFTAGPHTSLDENPHGRDVNEIKYLGVHVGELSIGVGLDGAWRRLDGQDEWLALALLTFRLPASFGVALVPIWASDASGDSTVRSSGWGSPVSGAKPFRNRNGATRFPPATGQMFER